MLSGILLAAGALSAGQNGNGTFSGQQVLSAVEAENLAFMREEEKLARDVYLYLFEVWGQWVFENIAAGGQQHMDAVGNLLEKYSLADPAAGNAAGEFTNQVLQNLYDSLTEQGSMSILDAHYGAQPLKIWTLRTWRGFLPKSTSRISSRSVKI